MSFIRASVDRRRCRSALDSVRFGNATDEAEAEASASLVCEGGREPMVTTRVHVSLDHLLGSTSPALSPRTGTSTKLPAQAQALVGGQSL
ncbi:hypothetical protein CCMA1212_001646 [Trichoderma ghanense]|uniref:Uncharacterized protein n=1 Tax=Trichoderma ghanense TaxID=65468 RepID=A0ABY2HBU2_9HYPO